MRNGDVAEREIGSSMEKEESELGRPLVEFAVISSVPEDDVSIAELREFGKWLATRWNAIRELELSSFEFVPEPRCVKVMSPSDEPNTEATYREIQSKCPQVSVVVHILPRPKSPEFGRYIEWMKSGAWKIAVFPQGILKVNAVTKFRAVDCSLNLVLTNMVKNMSQGIMKLSKDHHLKITATKPAGEENAELAVEGFSPPPKKVAIDELCWQTALHGSGRSRMQYNSDSPLANLVVKATGFPHKTSKWDVCRSLADYGICDVDGPSLDSGSNVECWFVQLASQFEALQLCESALNGRRELELHRRRFKLKFAPLGGRIRQEFNRYASQTALANMTNVA